jgi:hypothetical protein
LPYTIFEAVALGLYWLSFEEIEAEFRPPKSIWFDGKKQKEWWKAVDRKRREKYGLKGDGDIRDEPIDGPAERNAMMDELFVR